MIRRLLCRLGWHSWIEHRWPLNRGPFVFVYTTDHRCRHCGTVDYFF